VVGITVLTLLIIFGIRSAPTVLIKALEEEFGWQRADISFSIMIGLLTTGLAAPFGGALMDRFGPKRIMVAALTLLGASVAMGATVNSLWQLSLYWGILAGIGTGVSSILGASIANRWFVERRGLVQGAMGAGTSAGSLIFVPALTAMVVGIGWREATLILAGLAFLLVVPTLIFMRDSPAQMGLLPYGATAATPDVGAKPGPFREVMGGAVHAPVFWLLAGSFFVCGATSTGIVGTHFIPHATDHGIAEVTAASFFALMGAMNFVGTLFSGWLTDRYDPRRLLAVYYTFRGISLFALPFLTSSDIGLAGFAVLFGLDYIATVPPTAALCADIFGRRNVGLIYGWVFCAHQLGAGAAAYLGGIAHDVLGDYTLAFVGAGVFAVMGSLMALRIDRTPQAEAPLAPAAAAA